MIKYTSTLPKFWKKKKQWLIVRNSSVKFFISVFSFYFKIRVITSTLIALCILEHVKEVYCLPNMQLLIFWKMNKLKQSSGHKHHLKQNFSSSSGTNQMYRSFHSQQIAHLFLPAKFLISSVPLGMIHPKPRIQPAFHRRSRDKRGSPFRDVADQ